MEAPAAVDIIDAALLEARGYRKVTDALADLAGVVSGEHPETPSTFAMRGFERSQITVLRDGLWLGPSTMTMRHQNTFNLERVEVLRGPSSALNGNGAVAGNVNVVTKSSFETDQTSVNGLASYGRHNTMHLGIGAGGPLSDSLYYRVCRLGLSDSMRVSARVENAFDEEYLPWSSPFYLHQNDPGFLYANQLVVAAPRSYGLSFEFDF